MLGQDGAILGSHCKNLGFTVSEVLLWRGSVFCQPHTLSFHSLLLLLGQGTYKLHFPDSLACFLFFPDEDPGSLSHMAAALTATAAGNAGSGSSVPTAVTSLALWLYCRFHVTPFSLVFLQPKSGSGLLQ